MYITTVNEFRAALEQGKWAWPGGYPCYFLCADGGALSFEAATSEKTVIESAIAKPDSDKQWQVIGYDVNWEDTDLYCAHTNVQIESAYGEELI